jgi:ribosome biogenesis protein ERB1
VSYHQRYPLFASASDDGSVHVFHGRVFSDLLQNPLIVPVKKLEGHDVTGGLGTSGIMKKMVGKGALLCGEANSRVRLCCDLVFVIDAWVFALRRANSGN